ncbi:hypothetical protein BC940DRAFT_287491 [Gongronella butleri]|nr:hypothetical protein BC940DRAFT_287491 [Gongronella butleri]
MPPKLTNPVPPPAAIKSVCVFCGSHAGADPIYVEQAKLLGAQLAKHGIRVVYGGGSVGCMGAVAQGALENQGQLLAVVPETLAKQGSRQLCETIIVKDMHARKKTMANESQGFIVIPGGYGTMEEMLEMITWSQLNIHSKPIILLNTKNYFDHFVQWVRHCIQEKFIPDGNAEIFSVCETMEEVIASLETYSAPVTRYGFDWIDEQDQKDQQEQNASLV